MAISFRKHLRLCVFAVTVLGSCAAANADTVSFLWDPSVWNTNGDNFINGTEFSPTGSDGTGWEFTPTINPGVENLQLHETNGLRFGGGGNSSWEFTFTTDQDIWLESYTLTDTLDFTNPGVFDLVGTNFASNGNFSGPAATTYSFNNGPLFVTASETVTFVVESPGGSRQAYLSSFNYQSIAIPEPTSVVVLAGFGFAALLRRKRKLSV